MRKLISLLLCLAGVAACQSPTGTSTNNVDTATVSISVASTTTVGNTEKVSLTTSNVKAGSCTVTGTNANVTGSNGVWFLSANTAGTVVLTAVCSGTNGAQAKATDTVVVFDQPTLSLQGTSFTGQLLGSIDVPFTASNYSSIAVTCTNCGDKVTDTTQKPVFVSTSVIGNLIHIVLGSDMPDAPDADKIGRRHFSVVPMGLDGRTKGAALLFDVVLVPTPLDPSQITVDTLVCDGQSHGMRVHAKAPLFDRYNGWFGGLKVNTFNAVDDGGSFGYEDPQNASVITECVRPAGNYTAWLWNDGGQKVAVPFVIVTK